MRNAIQNTTSEFGLKKSTERFDCREAASTERHGRFGHGNSEFEETTRLTEQVRMESAKREDEASALQPETNELLASNDL